MENSIDENQSNEWNFVVNGIDTSLANALRRIMISQVPTIVIDVVTIKQNDSCLCDEIIAHRLGQIPLRKTKLDQDITDFKIKLEEVGPKRIYSGNIIFPPGIEPVSKDIILLNLGPDECIKICGNTEEGIGREHSKFSVCSGTSYEKINDNSFKFKIETNGSLTAKETWFKAIEILREELIYYKKLL